jgi:hypothetical protein
MQAPCLLKNFNNLHIPTRSAAKGSRISASQKDAQSKSQQLGFWFACLTPGLTPCVTVITWLCALEVVSEQHRALRGPSVTPSGSRQCQTGDSASFVATVGHSFGHHFKPWFVVLGGRLNVPCSTQRHQQSTQQWPRHQAPWQQAKGQGK